MVDHPKDTHQQVTKKHNTGQKRISIEELKGKKLLLTKNNAKALLTLPLKKNLNEA